MSFFSPLFSTVIFSICLLGIFVNVDTHSSDKNLRSSDKQVDDFIHNFENRLLRHERVTRDIRSKENLPLNNQPKENLPLKNESKGNLPLKIDVNSKKTVDIFKAQYKAPVTTKSPVVAKEKSKILNSVNNLEAKKDFPKQLSHSIDDKRINRSTNQKGVKKSPSQKVVKKRENQVISSVSTNSFQMSSSNSSKSTIKKKISSSENNQNLGTLTQKTDANHENAFSFENQSRTETKNDLTNQKMTNQMQISPTKTTDGGGVEKKETDSKVETTTPSAAVEFTVLDYEDDSSKSNKTQEVANDGVASVESDTAKSLIDDPPLTPTHSVFDSNIELVTSSSNISSIETSLENHDVEVVNEPVLRSPKPQCNEVISNMTVHFNKLKKQFNHLSKDLKSLLNSTCLDKNCCEEKSRALGRLINTAANTTTVVSENESVYMNNTKSDTTLINIVPYEQSQKNKKKKRVKSIPLLDVIIPFEDPTTALPTTTYETTTQQDFTESTTIPTTETTMLDETESTTVTEPTTIQSTTMANEAMFAPTTIQNDFEPTTETLSNEIFDFNFKTSKSKYVSTTPSPFKSSISYPDNKGEMKLVCNVEYAQPQLLRKGCFITGDTSPTGPDGVIKNPFSKKKSIKLNSLLRNQQQVCCYTNVDNNLPYISQFPYAPSAPYYPQMPQMYAPTGFGSMYPPWYPYMMQQPAPYPLQPQPLIVPCDNYPTGEAKSTPDNINIEVPTLTKSGRMLNLTSSKSAGNVACLDEEYACDNGKECISQSSYCDNVVHCSDASDETHCSCRSLVGPAKLCDGIFDCPKGEDELGCFDCPQNTFSCDNWDRRKSQATCVSFEKRCDFKTDCSNGKDEKDCSALTESVVEFEDNHVSYGDGYLHHNYEGKWYPVCYSTVNKLISNWALEVCQIEIDPEINNVEVLAQRLNSPYNGLYIQETFDGLTLVNNCESLKMVAYIQCPKPSCGSRLDYKSLLEKSQERMTRALNIFDSANYFRNFEEYPYDLGFRSNINNENMYSGDPHMEYFADRQDALNEYAYLKPSYDNHYNQMDPMLYNNEPIDQLRTNSVDDYNDAHMYIDPYSKLSTIHSPGVYIESCPSCRRNSYRELEYRNSLNEFGNIDHPNYNFIRKKRDTSGDEENGKFSNTVLGAGRVVGGKKSKIGAWPWLIALYRDGFFHCGGVVLDEYWVMTAAHCVDGFEKHYFEIYAGMLRRFSFSPTEQVRPVSRIVMHSMFRRIEMINDLALLRLETPLKFNRYVRPICLPDITENPNPYASCTAVGWGAIFEHGPDPDHMREVQVPILPSCKNYEDKLGDVICAGMPQGGRDTCQGDSGGPLLCKIPDEKERWYVAGVVSHGEGCARPNEPGVYTKVSQFLPWLLSNSEIYTNRIGYKKPIQECPGMQCSNRCIPMKRRCDGTVDCLNAEDEIGCNGLFYKDALLGLTRNVSAIEEDLTTTVLPTILELTTSAEDTTTSESTTLSDDTTTVEPTTENDITSTTVEYGDGTTTEGTTITTETTQADDTSTTEQPTTTELPTTINSQPKSSELKDNPSDNKVDRATLIPLIKKYEPPVIRTGKFSCSEIPQIIPGNRRCDGIIDCEDGTDEKECQCKDILMNQNQASLLCNGDIDCADQSDESFCSDCDEDTEFDCRKSQMCIPNQLRCDGVSDCILNEDESDCMMLVNNSTIDLDNADRPKFSMQGLVTVNVNGLWSVKCDSQPDEATAEDTCRNLGFDGSIKFDKLNVKKKDTTDNCTGLRLECSSYKNIQLNKTVPWHVDIYVNGMLKCSGILLDNSTVLTSEKCLTFVDISNDYVTAVVGRQIGSIRVMGPYEQVVRINSVNGPFARLSVPFELSYLSIPIQNPDKIPDVNPSETCMVTKYDQNNVPWNFELEALPNCATHKRCFRPKNDNSDNCQKLSLDRLSSSGVLCNGPEGWYVAAVYTAFSEFELDALCHGRTMDFVSAEQYLFSEIPRTFSDFDLKDPSCDGVRCGRGQCVSQSNICDGSTQCPDGADEATQLCSEQNDITDSNAKCQSNELQCVNKKCVSKSVYCDKKDDCGDGTDEPKDCATSCASYMRLSHPERMCDGRRNCLDKSDEMNCNYNCNDQVGYFKCPNNSTKCISNEFVCDGKFDCEDGSDEKYCYSLSTLGDRTKGVLLKNTYGLWNAECFDDSSDITPSLMNSRCQYMGFRFANKASTTKLIGKPKLDSFSVVKMKHRIKITLRGDRPIAEQNMIHTCLGLKLECNA